MKRFFTKTGIWLLGGAAVIAVVLCIISAMGSGTAFSTTRWVSLPLPSAQPDRLW